MGIRGAGCNQEPEGSKARAKNSELSAIAGGHFSSQPTIPRDICEANQNYRIRLLLLH